MKIYKITEVPPTMGHLKDVDQRVQLCADVLSHVRGQRQLSSKATEAGGQLFGTITAELITVSRATGPYTGDERSRYQYRSNPAAAQRAIQEQLHAGLLYLGEWHTHAEDLPCASSSDDDAMQLLLAGSNLNSNALLMLIVGRVESVAGLALFTVGAERVCRWDLDEGELVEKEVSSILEHTTRHGIMDNKHTPGPWEADSTHCRTAINSVATANNQRKHIAMVNLTKNPEYEITIKEHEANAKLIAEAPAMLDAIKEAVEWIEDDRFDDDYIMEEWYHKMKNILIKLVES